VPTAIPFSDKATAACSPSISGIQIFTLFIALTSPSGPFKVAPFISLRILVIA